MDTPFALISSAINVVVTGLFAAVVLRQYLRRHRSYQLYWFMGLLMAFVATLAYVFMLLTQPTSYNGIILFRAYYILGVLTPAWLGLGSVALITSPRVTTWCLTFLYLLSIATMALVLLAQIDMQHVESDCWSWYWNSTPRSVACRGYHHQHAWRCCSCGCGNLFGTKIVSAAAEHRRITYQQYSLGQCAYSPGRFG